MRRIFCSFLTLFLMAANVMPLPAKAKPQIACCCKGKASCGCMSGSNSHCCHSSHNPRTNEITFVRGACGQGSEDAVVSGLAPKGILAAVVLCHDAAFVSEPVRPCLRTVPKNLFDKRIDYPPETSPSQLS